MTSAGWHQFKLWTLRARYLTASWQKVNLLWKVQLIKYQTSKPNCFIRACGMDLISSHLDSWRTLTCLLCYSRLRRRQRIDDVISGSSRPIRSDPAIRDDPSRRSSLPQHSRRQPPGHEGEVHQESKADWSGGSVLTIDSNIRTKPLDLLFSWFVLLKLTSK